MIMSRSIAKHPKISWVCYFSNKKDKRLANRLFRRVNKLRVKLGLEPMHSLKECSDTYNFDSDGLPHWENNLDIKYLRK